MVPNMFLFSGNFFLSLKKPQPANLFPLRLLAGKKTYPTLTRNKGLIAALVSHDPKACYFWGGGVRHRPGPKVLRSEHALAAQGVRHFSKGIFYKPQALFFRNSGT